jgi:hypothetical protein
LLNKQMADELKTVAGNADAEAKIRKKYADLEKAQDKSTSDQKKALALSTINTIGGYAKAGIDAAQGFADLADQADKNRLKAGEILSVATQEKEFKRHQALSLAGAILNTAEGISKAVAESPETGGLPGSAIAAVMGGLQIAKILSTKFSPDGGGGGSAPTVSAPSIASAQSLNSSTGLNTRAGQFYGIGTANYNNTSGNNNQSDQRVVLVASDVNVQQNKDNRVAVRATLRGN